MLRRLLPPLVLALGLASACGSNGDRAPTTTGTDGGVGGGGDGGPGDFVDSGGDAGARVCTPDGLDQAGCSCKTFGETRACYTGAPETRAKGVCHDGTQTCQGSGEFLTWSPCTGDAVPHKEACGSKVDINCNGSVGCEDPSCASDPTCDTPCTDGQKRPCYEGAAGTENVGACKDGQQTCIGGHWTKACTGQVLPGKEAGQCGDQLDNDCNGAADCKDLACLLDLHCLLGCTAGSTRNCYEGPPGTEGVASCHGGTQTCKPDGSGFGPCTGQVLPSTEAGHCGDSSDNDCDGFIDCADSECAVTAACCVVNPSPADGTIWANSPTTLYRIDPSTFVVTTVGKFNSGDSITDLALTPSGDLYAISFTELYKVDKSTGAATPIKTLSGTGNDGMTFLPNGNLIAGDSAGDLTLINPSTGSISTIGNFGSGLKMAGDMVAVKNGTTYGTSSAAAGGADATSNNVLMQVDVATGHATAIGPTGHANVWGVAYANGHVIGFDTAGEILQIDPATGASTVLAQKSIEFWGATQSPLVDGNKCP